MNLPENAVQVAWNPQTRSLSVAIHVAFESNPVPKDDPRGDAMLASQASEFVTMSIHKAILAKILSKFKDDLPRSN